jgi:hypothetical protein
MDDGKTGAPMRIRMRTVEAIAGIWSILLIASALVAVDGRAQTADPEDSAQVEGGAPEDGHEADTLQDEPEAGAEPTATDAGAPQDGSDGDAAGSQGVTAEERGQWRAAREARRKARVEQARLAKETRDRTEAAPTARGEVGGRRSGSVATRITAPISRPVVLTSIEVFFKLDPRDAKGGSLSLEEHWVPPPIALALGAQDGTAATLQVRAYALDSAGQFVEIGPEWLPADPQMVAVSPGRGTEVAVTVRVGGKSDLRVVSEKVRVSTTLSITAWHQGGALQVRISQRP